MPMDGILNRELTAVAVSHNAHLLRHIRKHLRISILWIERMRDRAKEEEKNKPNRNWTLQQHKLKCVQVKVFPAFLIFDEKKSSRQKNSLDAA